jgi:hypothetical protein
MWLESRNTMSTLRNTMCNNSVTQLWEIIFPGPKSGSDLLPSLLSMSINLVVPLLSVVEMSCLVSLKQAPMKWVVGHFKALRNAIAVSLRSSMLIKSVISHRLKEEDPQQQHNRKASFNNVVYPIQILENTSKETSWCLYVNTRKQV